MKYDESVCKFNMDTGCVELLLRDGRKISINCTGVEDALDVTMAQRSELDYLIYNDPLGYADLILNGDPEELIRSCTLEILNANGCIVDEMNLDSAIPMNWKEAVPEDEITKFKEETGNEYGVQIDSIPEFKPRKKFVRKDG